MNNTSTLYGIIGFLLGIVLTIVVVNNQMYGMMRMMGMGDTGDSIQRGMMMDQEHVDGMGMSMSDMEDELQGKTGDEFDKAFLSNMIVHHQGAIEMATLAKQNAKHDEIKQLSDDIIAAQTSEIDKMEGWQQDWGY